jgi:hypothetical protein
MMALESFLSSIASLITALGLLVASLASLFQAYRSLPKKSSPSRSHPENPPGQPARETSRGSILLKNPIFDLGLLLALLSISIFIGRSLLRPTPQVAITTPSAGQAVDVKLLPSTGSASFMVSGSSSNTEAYPQMRIYLLVHPADPFASGWWVQASPAVVDPGGRWTVQSWYGDKSFPPLPGNKIDLLALVADPQQVAGQTQIDSPNNLNPIAQSAVITITFRAVQ